MRDLVFAGITAHDNGNIFHLFKLCSENYSFFFDSGIARHFFSWWDKADSGIASNKILF
jgi:hypothetical protein